MPSDFLDYCDAAILAVLIVWSVMDRCGTYLRKPPT